MILASTPKGDLDWTFDESHREVILDLPDVDLADVEIAYGFLNRDGSKALDTYSVLKHREARKPVDPPADDPPAPPAGEVLATPPVEPPAPPAPVVVQSKTPKSAK